MAKQIGKLPENMLDIFQKNVAAAPIKPIARARCIKGRANDFLPEMDPNERQQSREQLPIFQKPMPLICKNNAGQLTYNTDAINDLRKIELPLNIVAVVGSLRTGKSTLLNKLANIKTGARFEIGHAVNTITKGIWIMCVNHPVQQDQVLVLLDTEGVGDPHKLDRGEDEWLLVLATLLCSTLVYNYKGVFDQTILERFKFLKVIESTVKLDEKCDNDFLLDFYFPIFVFALRDFTLQMPESSDAYLEWSLVMMNGMMDQSKIYNEPRRLIRRYFLERKCFIFVPPAQVTKLNKIMELDDSEFEPLFLTKLEEFKNYIYSLKPKMLKSGKTINGRMFSTLVQSYVNAIKQTQCPCIMKALQHMIDNENQYVISCAAELYKKNMQKRLAKHMPNDQGIELYHKECTQLAISYLQKTTVYNDNEIINKQVLEHFNAHRKEFQRQIDEDCKKRCETKLGFLNKTVERKLKNGEYNVPTGYDDYWNDINHIITQYKREIPYQGIQARNVLQEFVDNKEKEEQIVYELVLKMQTKAAKKQQSSSCVAAKTNINMTLRNCQDEENDICTADISKRVEEMQEISSNSIQCQYTDMMKLKEQELPKVTEELSRNDPYCLILMEEYKKLDTILGMNKGAKQQQNACVLQ